MSRADRRLGDRGVTIVEAAFALPILLTFVFGLVDLGMWTLNANQATNAARDGARAAILDFETADVPSSADWNAVQTAVEQHLDREVDSLIVTCIDPDDVTISCATADVDVDRIRVETEWDWTLVTPVAAILGYEDGRAAASATMNIVGRPLASTSTSTSTTTTTTTTTTPDSTTTTSTAPAACAVQSLTVAPDPIARSKSGASQLAEALVIEFSTNGSAACDELVVRLIPTHDTDPVDAPCGCGEGPSDFSFSYEGSSNIWKDGQGQVQVYNGTTLLDAETFWVS